VELVVLALGGSLLAGGIAAYLAVYNQNIVLGLLVFATGVGILSVLMGSDIIAPGPTGGFDAILELAGIPGLIGAAIGAGVGGWVGHQQRERERRP
jgi:hypothetical protein